ncbi:MAG: tetratricopeptide repeat protein [Gemmatimonadaceae bacterium]|nr:tetratricopeptide repeat protein [Gemmatimonadaceae bacterium]
MLGTRWSYGLPALTLWLAGCASGGVRDPNAAIARLEAARAKNPNATAAIRSLGVAYYSAKRYPEARAALDTARLRDPRDGVAALYAGLTAEAQQDLRGAKDAYTAYLAAGRTPKVRTQIRQRLAFVNRQELTQTAKASLAAEATLGATAGDAKTVAVPPFRFSGSDTTLLPLERGMADLLITDLATAKELTVVERDRMQAIVDEIALTQGNRVDDATAVRAGKLLRAGRIVQGGISQTAPTALQLNAAVVDVPTAQAVGSASADEQLEKLFDAEKVLAIQVLQSLGVTLSVAQREAIEKKPTRSFAAFLAYSRGLVAEDRGDFDAALRSYQDAIRIDPGFLRATARQSQASAAVSGAQVSSNSIEQSLTGTSEGSVANGAKSGEVVSGGTSIGTVNSTANNLNPTQSGNQTNSQQPTTGGTTGTGGIGGTTTNPPPNQTPPPTTQPPATQTGRVVIVVPRP